MTGRDPATHLYFSSVSRLVARGACTGGIACVGHTAILENERITAFDEDAFIELDELHRTIVKVTSDILINRSMFGEAKLKILASGVRFDTCKDAGESYYAYATLVHEAGHALGLSFRSVNVGDAMLSVGYHHPSTNLGRVAMGKSLGYAACTPFPSRRDGHLRVVPDASVNGVNGVGVGPKGRVLTVVALLLISALGTYGCQQILLHRALKSGFAERRRRAARVA